VFIWACGNNGGLFPQFFLKFFSCWNINKHILHLFKALALFVKAYLKLSWTSVLFLSIHSGCHTGATGRLSEGNEMQVMETRQFNLSSWADVKLYLGMVDGATRKGRTTLRKTCEMVQGLTRTGPVLIKKQIGLLLELHICLQTDFKIRCIDKVAGFCTKSMNSICF